MHNGHPVEYATVFIESSNLHTQTDSSGHFMLCSDVPGTYTLQAGMVGFTTFHKKVEITGDTTDLGKISIYPDEKTLNEVVISGSLKEIDKKESPANVEVYTPGYLRKNPTPNFFESLQIVNGVRPQINCNVCNTGDVHINGMEGPYTMVTIDGMPIVSSLSSVYGLMGIPNGIVERIEIVKGPASTLYGSEAMGGLINVITKNPATAPVVSLDVMGTTYRDMNIDGSFKASIGNVSTLIGVNYYTFTTYWDLNKDHFTDATLQNRVSVFNKWSLTRKEYRQASIAGRYVYENRWGGEMNWNETWRGSDSIYGESIMTNRAEIIGIYQLPVHEKIFLQFSYNYHHQDSYYGQYPYMATQQVAFAQVYWDKPIGKKNSLLTGITYRYTFYDDNTPGTQSADSLNPVNQPQHTHLPGIFMQDEWKLHPRHKLLAGIRYDYNLVHGSIFSPRINYKWDLHKNHILRFSFGNGYRVVNLFTEDHAALTGARQVVITESLKPETSYNGNINYNGTITHTAGFINIDFTGFYTYFTNKITGDYTTNANQIIYSNLKGYAVSTGASLSLDISFTFGLRIHTGITFMDVYQVKKDSAGFTHRSSQYFAPPWSGTYAVTYTFPGGKWSMDVTGSWNGPMRLPVLPNDFRPGYSPWFNLMNIQVTKKWDNGIELYAGIKNVLNFLPRDPIMRPFDPFDKQVNDPVNNPYGYTFDTAYNYAPMQAIRGFGGIRYTLH